MLRVVFIASGTEYQEAAALAASTFALHGGVAGAISVLLPRYEHVRSNLSVYSRRFNFVVERFPLEANPGHHYTTQLKCQAFAWKIASLSHKDFVLFADADTCCLRPVRFPVKITREIHFGRIGLVPDIADRHFRDPSVPWYLTPPEREIYVNSGVILASRQSLCFFEKVRALSNERRFLTGPFNDQKVINFALGKYFPNVLLPLHQKFNTIRDGGRQTVIAHFAGGAGLLGQQHRKIAHRRMCLAVIGTRPRQTRS